MPAIAPSQLVIDIEEVRDGVIVMKDHSLRALLMTSSLNFALKSQDEQTAISMQYQSFLNSLDFPVQFFITSRKLNIGPYLDTLKEAEKKQTSDLLKVQITEYMEFIKTFVQASNIMSKSFYIVVPFNSPSAAEATGISKWLSFGRSSKTPKMLDPVAFEEYKTQLWQRVDQVIGGITRAGIRGAPLNTEELIELFYGLYNPGESDKGKPPISS
jgi:type IV secretory pathway VirB4 component